MLTGRMGEIHGLDHQSERGEWMETIQLITRRDESKVTKIS